MFWHTGLAAFLPDLFTSCHDSCFPFLSILLIWSVRCKSKSPGESKLSHPIDAGGRSKTEILYLRLKKADTHNRDCMSNWGQEQEPTPCCYTQCPLPHLTSVSPLDRKEQLLAHSDLICSSCCGPVVCNPHIGTHTVTQN